MSDLKRNVITIKNLIYVKRKGADMYQYVIYFMVVVVVMCVVADVAFRIEMKHYKKKLARKWNVEKGSTGDNSGYDRR